jgi:predicted ATPase
VRFLETKDLLLVLDNCEHLLHACEQLIGDLLTGTRTMRLLATSREPLVIERGVVWRVPSMSLPAVQCPGGAQLASELMESEAVRLFVERAGVSQLFSLTESNAAAVAQICVRLDGIPLALELAAAWASVLTAQQIAARLDHPFWLLANRGASASPRHQTLRATIDWSYALLGQRERRMLDRLAVFAGDWSLEAAERICAGDGIDKHDVLGLVGRLVDTSLVVADVEGTAARYRLLETIHHYAEERLEGAGDRDNARHRFAAYFLDLAERYAPDLYAGRSGGRGDALEGITREYDNIRAVLRWSIQTGEIGIGLRLANAIGQFWLSRAHLSEGRAWLAELLARVSGQSMMAPSSAAHLASIGLAARLAAAQGEHQVARLLLEDRLARARAVDDRRAVVDSLMLLGAVVEAAQDETSAAEYYAHALRLARELADARVRGYRGDL